MPEVNLGVVLAVAAIVVSLASYFSKAIIDANNELRIEQATMKAEAKARDTRLKVLEDLTTSRAAVDELGGYVGQMRRDFSEEHGQMLTVMKEIAASLHRVEAVGLNTPPAATT